MIVLGNKIPDFIVQEVTQAALVGDKTAMRLEMQARQLLAGAGMGNFEGAVAMRLADGVLKKLRRRGELKPVRRKRCIVWERCMPDVSSIHEGAHSPIGE